MGKRRAFFPLWAVRDLAQDPPTRRVFCYNTLVVEELTMDLSELIDEVREINLYESDPQDWMGYLENDDYWVPDPELAY
jgi:hypothetical protein